MAESVRSEGEKVKTLFNEIETLFAVYQARWGVISSLLLLRQVEYTTIADIADLVMPKPL
jgi:hypothetical protein